MPNSTTETMRGRSGTMSSKIVGNLIDGDWITSPAAETIDDVNPADERDVLAALDKADSATVTAAVTAASAASAGWRRMSAIDRGAILLNAAARLRAQLHPVALDVARENGKTLAEATGEVTKAADMLEYYGGLGRAPQGSVLPDARPRSFTHTRLEPVGVVAILTPWNDPILTPARKLGPALIAGNTVVIKPAATTPMALEHLVTALVEAGLPAGVVNMVYAPHATIENALLDSPLISAVTITGSTASGLALGARLGGRQVRFQAEMGGKNTAVVMPDADLDHAVATIVSAGFAQAGQRCTATSRVLVHAQVEAEFLQRFTAASSGLAVGPGTAEGTQMGPLVSRTQQTTVDTFVQGADGQGGRILTGGSSLTSGDYRHGYFYAPTVIASATDHTVWNEEIFGPVVATATFDDLDDALVKTNASRYGLAASIFTQSISTAMRFVDEVDCGQVSINLPTSGWDVHHPFGGFRDSGSPFKEQGLEALSFYTKTKTAALQHLGSEGR